MIHHQQYPEWIQCVLDIISGRKRPAEICREHNISESLLSRWRQQFTEEAPRFFEPKKVFFANWCVKIKMPTR
ncbi:MAG: transposase [Candidatus Poribacteria bacterium]